MGLTGTGGCQRGQDPTDPTGLHRGTTAIGGAPIAPCGPLSPGGSRDTALIAGSQRRGFPLLAPPPPTARLLFSSVGWASALDFVQRTPLLKTKPHM